MEDKEIKACSKCGIKGPRSQLFDPKGNVCKVCRKKTVNEKYQKTKKPKKPRKKPKVIKPGEIRKCRDCGVRGKGKVFVKSDPTWCKWCKRASQRRWYLKRHKKGWKPVRLINRKAKTGMDICCTCRKEKPLAEFYKGKKHICKECGRANKRKSMAKIRADKPKVKIRFRVCIECGANKKLSAFATKRSVVCNKCKPKRTKRLRNKQMKERRKNDIKFSVMDSISSAINNVIDKQGESCRKHIPWTWVQFVARFEALFQHPDNLGPDGKPWMTWQNRGYYRKKTWDNNDSATWRWQVDHIIPKSLFHYTTMDCKEFRECWGLDNLRPLSAKQNILDGPRRVRH